MEFRSRSASIKVDVPHFKQKHVVNQQISRFLQRARECMSVDQGQYVQC